MSEAWVRSILRRWWVVLICVAGALLGAGFLTYRQVPVFEASASLVVTPNTEIQEATDLIRSLETLERRTIVATFAKIPLAPETRSAAADLMDVDPRDIRGYRIASSVQPYTNIVLITVSGPDRDRVAEVANAVAEATQESARSMYRIFSMKPLAGAVPAYRPVRPDPVRNYSVAATLGVLLGLICAAWLARRDGSGAQTS